MTNSLINFRIVYVILLKKKNSKIKPLINLSIIENV